MLASIAGSQGVGKSTVCASLPFQQITRKTSRSILSDWGLQLSQVNNSRDLTVRFQEEILKRKKFDERNAVDSHEVWITERTYADLFTYAVVALGKDNEYSNWLNEYYDKCKEAQNGYYHTFYLTGGSFAPVDDGVRAINPHYSKLVDLTMLHNTTQMSNPSNLTIVDTPIHVDRVSMIHHTINNKG